MLDDDGDSYELVCYAKKQIIQKYHRVKIYQHTRGILRKHRCQGSCKKVVTIVR